MTRKKAVAGLLSLSFLIAGGAAWQFTATVDTNFQDFYSQAWGIDGDIGEAVACNALTSYAIPECTEPINIDLGGATTTEVQWSVANTAAIATDNREQVLGSTEKRLNASYGVSMAEAKAEAIEDLNAGATEAKATGNASDIVRDWYSEIQRNVWNYRQRHWLKIKTAVEEVNQTSGLACSDVFQVWEEGKEYDDTHNKVWDGQSCENITFTEESKTLYNGEQLNVTVPEVLLVNEDNPGDWSVHHRKDWIPLSQSEFTVYFGEKSNKVMDVQMRVVDPDGNHTMMYESPKYNTTLENLVSTKDRAISNVNTVVSDIYGSYSEGDVNVSGSLGALEVLKTASTSYNSTGYYDYATLTAKQMGLETNDTYAFKLEWSPENSNDTFTDIGQLFLDETAFNGTIETGTQYNVTDQVVWFTRTADNGQIVQEELDGTFTPLEITNKNTGETVNSTTTQQVDVYRSNTTDLEKQLENLADQLEEYQDEEPGGTAGGGGTAAGLFGLSPEATGLGAVAGVFALILLGVLLA